MFNFFNPIKVGGSESKYSFPIGKALDNKYRVEILDLSPIFHGQLKKKKLKTDNFKNLGSREGGKNA